MGEFEDHLKRYFDRPIEVRLKQIRAFLNNDPSPLVQKHAIGIFAHIGAGKATLVDRHMYLLSIRDFKPF